MIVLFQLSDVPMVHLDQGGFCRVHCIHYKHAWRTLYDRIFCLLLC